MARELLGGWIVASRRTGALAAGDLLAIALFVALGELRHGGTLAAGAETFAQFAVGWAIAGVALGAYSRRATAAPPSTAAGWAVGAWTAAALAGQAVRLLAEPGKVLLPSFVLVSVGAGALLVGGWRWLAARRRRG